MRIALLALLAFAPVLNAAPWPNSPLTRRQAEALLETFTAELLASHSATQIPQHWRAEDALAREAVIRAQVLPEARAADAEVRADLKVDAREPLRYGRMQLRCGDKVLSVADNWYPELIGQHAFRLMWSSRWYRERSSVHSLRQPPELVIHDHHENCCAARAGRS